MRRLELVLIEDDDDEELLDSLELPEGVNLEALLNLISDFLSQN